MCTPRGGQYKALAMSWENFDINNCQYQVTESVKLGKFGPPKSGERLVDLDVALVTKIGAYQRKWERGRSGSLPGISSQKSRSV